jgi:hypothetical protein
MPIFHANPPVDLASSGAPLKCNKPHKSITTDVVRQARTMRDVVLKLADLHCRRCDRVQAEQEALLFTGHAELRERERMSALLLELLHGRTPSERTM